MNDYLYFQNKPNIVVISGFRNFCIQKSRESAILQRLVIKRYAAFSREKRTIKQL